jgi:hypothetical protein
MGKGEGARAETGDETHTDNLSSRSKENRSGTAGAVGEGEGGEEGGVKHGARIRPLLSVAGFLFDEESLRLECQMS